jgi:hypothetical protein
VASAACSVTNARPGQYIAPPLTTPRIPTAGDPAVLAHLRAFAAATDPRYAVLGPEAWACHSQFSENGNDLMAVYDPATQFEKTYDALLRAPIAIDNDRLWHGAAVTACSVFDDPAVVQNVTRLSPHDLPCPRAGRTVTRLSAQVSTFVDVDGARGVGWIKLPSPQGADGFVSVLTCRPTAGLTAADCDTIVADFATRLRSSG